MMSIPREKKEKLKNHFYKYDANKIGQNKNNWYDIAANGVATLLNVANHMDDTKDEFEIQNEANL